MDYYDYDYYDDFGCSGESISSILKEMHEPHCFSTNGERKEAAKVYRCRLEMAGADMDTIDAAIEEFCEVNWTDSEMNEYMTGDEDDDSWGY